VKWFLLALVLSGCEDEPAFPRKLYSTDKELLAYLTKCETIWEDRIGMDAIEIVDGQWPDSGDCHDVPVRLTKPQSGDVGFTYTGDRCDSKIEIDPELLEIWIVCHEVGHIFRVPHNPSQGFLMTHEGYVSLKTTDPEIEKARETVMRYAD
jgi:hypothetical protein